MKQLALTILTLPILAATTPAQTVFVVDDAPGPGVDFTDLQAAVDAAGPSDLIDVRSGLYGNVTIDKQVTILGEADGLLPGVEPRTLIGELTIQNVGAAEQVLITDLEVLRFSAELRVQNCGGIVLLENVRARIMNAVNAADLRMQHCDIERSGARVTNSTLQATSCEFKSWVNISRAGLEVAGTSRAYVAHSLVQGARGENAPSGCVLGSGATGGPGGDALRISGPSDVRILQTSLDEGEGGSNACNFGTGPHGERYSAVPGTSLVFDALISGGVTTPFPPIEPPGASVGVIPDLPVQRVVGFSVPGETIAFETRSGPGTSTRLFAGRFPRLEPLPDRVPLTCTFDRGVSLGSMVAAGRRVVNFTIPPLPRGTLIFLQSSRVRADGQTELSNGAFTVVR